MSSQDQNVRQNRQRSRQKQFNPKRNNNDQNLEYDQNNSQKDHFKSQSKQIKLQNGQMHYEEYMQKQQEFQQNQQILRSFLRIQQGRQQPIDKFVKILYIYKGKYEFDPKIQQLMLQPKQYLNKLTIQQLYSMITPAKRHLNSQQKFETKFVNYWKSLLNLIQYKIFKKESKLKQVSQEEQSLNSYQIKQKIKNMLNKNEQELKKLLNKIQTMIKNLNYGGDVSYWQKVKGKIKGKLIEVQLKKYYQSYKKQHQKQIQKLKSDFELNQNLQEEISPILQPFSSVNHRFIINQEQDLQERKKLSQDIFRQQFQKNKQKLQNNLSLPKNHNLLDKDFVASSTKTYDLITQQIMEFEKYKRLQDDQQEFDDWLPIQTEGRFRDRKPQYVNRVRISRDRTRYGQSGIIRQKQDQKNPSLKQIQGYKFNIFYPDLFDKQKTPQYYLEPLEDPNYMLIKFKAGPPYKDIGFKILRKQWDFTQKSGFEAIFTKGILQLYFNFKKPKYRI